MVKCAQVGCDVQVIATYKHPGEAEPVCPVHCKVPDCHVIPHKAHRDAIAAAVAAAAPAPAPGDGSDAGAGDGAAGGGGGGGGGSSADASPAGNEPPKAFDPAALLALLGKMGDAIKASSDTQAALASVSTASASTRSAPASSPSSDKSVATRASDWGLDATTFVDHPSQWTAEKTSSLVRAIKAHSVDHVRTQRAIEASRLAKTSLKIGETHVAPIELSSGSVKSFAYDATFQQVAPYHDVRNMASLLCLAGALSPNPDSQPDGAGAAAGSAAGAASAARSGRAAAAAELSAAAGGYDPEATSSPPIADFTVPLADVREGGRGHVHLRSLVNELASPKLEAAGRRRLLEIITVINKEHAHDSTQFVIVDKDGRKAVVKWVDHAAKILFASYLLFLRRQDSEWTPDDLAKILLPDAAPRRQPWPIRDSVTPIDLLPDLIDLGLLDYAERSPNSATAVGQSASACESAIRHWFTRWQKEFVLSGFNRDRLRAYENEKAAASTGTARQRGNDRGNNGNPNGRNPTNPVRGRQAAAATADASAAAAGAGAAGAGAGVATAAAVPPITGVRRPATGPPGPGQPPTARARVLYKKCHWVPRDGGAPCTSTPPAAVVAIQGGVTDPLCGRHRREFNNLVDADRSAAVDRLRAAGVTNFD